MNRRKSHYSDNLAHRLVCDDFFADPKVGGGFTTVYKVGANTRQVLAVDKDHRWGKFYLVNLVTKTAHPLGPPFVCLPTPLGFQ
jgi:hypothetical protein